MKTATFKEWTLTTLDKAFGLCQIWECALMDNWENQEIEIDDFEKKTLLNLQKHQIRGGRAWNEVELENKFISPVIMTANIDDEQIGYFLERRLSGIVGDYELSGIVDGMIATGFRDPDIPLFCLHEYKHRCDNQGSPDAQALAAMLVAREQNDNQKAIYDVFVVGLVWNFMILNGNEYFISKTYHADEEEIFAIFKMLKVLKKIIKDNLIN
ncbi:MAG: hypothetical protein DRR16_24245 [Candidatus Parabeggiatoa sp. nov. 3]|nr:MAG: hypothetical protein DRR00_27100 [Gammaproteobacteria bacterium]RKZ80225.1 MAG: hypothetical protein DRR16_24245 [Gammaproteobacteria bacterium]